LRQPAAEALHAAQRALAKKGVGICIFDAYRPYSVTLRLWQYLHDERYVAAPWTGSRHNRGCAVDLTLFDFNGWENFALLDLPFAVLSDDI
jgi:D-alanyl-D-alanine dipeptidase